eukprot:6492191-Amphidinium_carterae.1
MLAQLVGLPCDETKDADDSSCMVVLGAQVSVVFEPQPKVTMKVDKSKAVKWATALREHLASKHMPPGDAAKFAGKLSFAVTVQANKVGRAFVKPFFAQSHDPLHGNAISALLQQAIRWWLEYLELRPPAVRRLWQLNRPQTVMWTDASGEGWLGAVLHSEGSFAYTRLLAPELIVSQLLPRADCQIGFLEFLAVAMALETFSLQIVGTALTVYVDNEGVRAAMHKGSGGTVEVNIAIGKMWMQIALQDVALWTARVESHSNIADGPTRHDLSELERLDATFCAPELPSWVKSVWCLANEA